MPNPAKSSTEEVLEIIKMALERREEVFAIVDQAADKEDAAVGLAKLFDVNESLCMSVLDLSVRSWLPSWRNRVDEELEKHRSIRLQGSPE